MPVKSIYVPEVEACDVADVITELAIDDIDAPVIVGLVSVLLVSVCVSVVPTIVPEGCVP